MIVATRPCLKHHFWLILRILALALLPSLSAFGQAAPLPDQASGAGPDAGADRESRVLLAISNEQYPVTPGDAFLLSFLSGGEAIRDEVYVNGDYQVNLGLVGTLDGRGMTFLQLSERIREAVLGAYPSSNPSVRLLDVGAFWVPVYGAIERGRRVEAWGLSHLSDVVSPLLQPYSSRRRVRVNRGGRTREYDLFAAQRLGRRAEDPILRPGDTVEVLPAGRRIEVSGEVNRPGSYEVTQSDALSDLLEYSGGLTDRADLSRVRVEYRDPERDAARWETIDDGESDLSLSHLRSIFISAEPERRGFVIVSGAVVGPEETAAFDFAAADPLAIRSMAEADEDSLQLRLPIAEGETLGDLFIRLQDRLSGRADLSNVLLLREEEPLLEGIDLNALRSEVSQAASFELRPGDRLHIPFRTPFSVDFDTFVVVTGAVYVPGRYELREGRDAHYYIRQAGGPDPELNRGGDYTIIDEEGNLREPDAIPQAGDTITVAHNDKIYVFGRYLPIVTGGLGLMTTVLALLVVFAGI